ncbi:hypothetical protein I2486_13615 [Cellulophaga sp. E16_2]|uniref:Uncharacterized protein n=1 Tax=Cellulophaga algicola (strain DSM 14237 / IC166 / ACAM 630) TaxID=688270 RepID=E6XC60_CELAD|nr:MULTISPECIES: hypothetical protein [Cellulophaga]ADV50065.1 hypothetical protein Celal_2783 [Cellulophaga algicola DSM 14237]MBO0592440.1 hypothetical protein [Cellulophaga sp. E16_2]
MKSIITLFFITITSITIAQSETHLEKISTLEPDLWLGIWDSANSSTKIKIDTLSYDDIPKTLDFRGTVVEALHWEDALGNNILIQTVTGHFNWKDYEDNGTDYMVQDKAELYAYLFTKKKGESTYQRKWKIYDYTACFGVDWHIGFLAKATTITDIDEDGISEISIPYLVVCRGGMDPSSLKIIMYEDNEKYALRGETMIMCGSEDSYGGDFTMSDTVQNNTSFKNFLVQRWDSTKCEDGMQF